MARYWLATGVISGNANQAQVYADSSGMQVKVRTGAAWVQGHYWESDAEVTLSIAAAHATLSRIDRVVLRLDWTNNTMALAVLTGTAAASPSAPSLTQTFGSTWELPLAQVLVDPAVVTIAAGKVTDQRVLVGPSPATAIDQVKLAEVTLSGNQTTIDLTAIPATYAHLRIVFKLRSTLSNDDDDLRVRFNADSGSNYDSQFGKTVGTSRTENPLGGQSYMRPGAVPAATAPSDNYCVGELTIPDYRGADQKTLSAHGGYARGTSTSNMVTWEGMGHWRNTAAITQVSFLSSSSMAAGSRVTLYGMA